MTGCFFSKNVSNYGFISKTRNLLFYNDEITFIYYARLYDFFVAIDLVVRSRSFYNRYTNESLNVYNISRVNVIINKLRSFRQEYTCWIVQGDDEEKEKGCFVYSPQSNFKGALKRPFITPGDVRGWFANARNVQVK